MAQLVNCRYLVRSPDGRLIIGHDRPEAEELPFGYPFL